MEIGAGRDVVVATPGRDRSPLTQQRQDTPLLEALAKLSNRPAKHGESEQIWWSTVFRKPPV
jgi:hypothetical protein